VKVLDGWQYQNGSVWPSLNALRDHLLGVSRAEAASRVPDWAQGLVA